MDQVLISLLYIFYKKKKKTQNPQNLLQITLTCIYVFYCIININKISIGVFCCFFNISNHMVELKGLSERHVWCRLLSTV